MFILLAIVNFCTRPLAFSSRVVFFCVFYAWFSVRLQYM